MNRWPLREALEHFYLIARERALADFRHAQLIYALQAPHVAKGVTLDPPERPEILGG